MNSANDQQPLGAAVTLSSDDVGHAVRLLRLLTGAESPASAPISTESLMTVARLSLLAREGRTKHFPRAMFGEPAWDLLLRLYVESSSETAPTVSSLAKSANVPVTTAMRWMDYLEEKQLIKRERSDVDRRVSTIELSSSGRKRIEAYMAEVLVRMVRTPLCE